MSAYTEFSGVRQGSKVWHGLRSGRLTSSLFGTALDVNPYQKSRQAWRELTGIAPQFNGNQATAYGHQWEEPIRQAYEDWSGELVHETGFVVPAPPLSWLGASTDGLIGSDGLLEVKVPYSGRSYGGVPRHYMAQVQGGLGITRRQWCDFVVGFPNEHGDGEHELEVWRVEFSQEYWEVMLQGLRWFWDHVVHNREIPKRGRGKVREPGSINPFGESLPEVPVERRR